MLQAYLASRPGEPPFPDVDRSRLTVGGAAIVTTTMGLGAMDTGGWLAYALAAIGIGMGAFALRPRKKAPPTPEQALARQADHVVTQLRHHADRLHRALHPAVGATLEECAGYVARIQVSLEGSGWEAAGSQWAALRNDARGAAKIAMDEALVHAGATLPYAVPARPLEQVSDALEDIGLGSLLRDGRNHEPMPPAFRPVRDLAERLRELAVRCETAAVQRREESPEPVSMAFRRLDAALGEMRGIEEAEGELRQGA